MYRHNGSGFEQNSEDSIYTEAEIKIETVMTKLPHVLDKNGYLKHVLRFRESDT